MLQIGVKVHARAVLIASLTTSATRGGVGGDAATAVLVVPIENA